MTCKSVLIVEDDVDIRDTLSELLQLEGYAVLVAENGQQALDHLAVMARPCLILLDLMMPVMNGWDFLKELRAHAQNDILATIPVVIISAAGESAQSARKISQGFIKKPIDLDCLLREVKQHCG